MVTNSVDPRLVLSRGDLENTERVVGVLLRTYKVNRDFKNRMNDFLVDLGNVPLAADVRSFDELDAVDCATTKVLRQLWKLWKEL